MRYDHFSQIKTYLSKMCDAIMSKKYFNTGDDLDYKNVNTQDLLTGIYNSSVTAGEIATSIFFYYSPYSPKRGDVRLLKYAYEATKVFIEHTNSDGSQDLFVTNYHDPNQVGFHVNTLKVIDLLVKYTNHTDLEEKLFANILTMVDMSAKALTKLGFHTPNHRWVQTSALMLLKRYKDSEDIQNTIDRYLWEGIDCDEDGEYTERSAGQYNYVNNESFIFMYYNTHDKSYLEYPRRNLMLMKSMTEPNNMINTMNSLRQDAGATNISITKYYWQYLLVAALLQDHELAYVADQLFEILKREDAYQGYFFSTYITDIDNIEELINNCESYTDIKDCSRFLKNSGIAREYRLDNKVAVTISKANGASVPDIFKIQFENVSVTGRYGASFFGPPHSQFRPYDIVKNEDGSISLIGHEEQGYRSQFDEKPETSVWRHMDHSKRKWINIQTFDTVITFKVNEDNVDINIKSNGTSNVCTKFELGFDYNDLSRIVTKNNTTILTNNGGYMVCNEDFNYLFPDSGIKFTIKGGRSDNVYAKDMRGVVPPEKTRYIVAFTAQTPCEKNINIKFSRLRHFNDILNFD